MDDDTQQALVSIRVTLESNAVGPTNAAFEGSTLWFRNWSVEWGCSSADICPSSARSGTSRTLERPPRHPTSHRGQYIVTLDIQENSAS